MARAGPRARPRGARGGARGRGGGRARARAARGAARAGAGGGGGGEWEVVVGVETHVQLSTASKAFCSCPVSFGRVSNRHVCPVCMGLPGSLPVLNEQVPRRAVAMGLALNCEIELHSKFDRKQYFYPDLPKGYQISQHDVPVGRGGRVDVTLPLGAGKRRIALERLHIEEDTGKLTHEGADALAGSDASLGDYNRAGTPLLEIVTEPCMSSGQEASEYAQELQRLVRFTGVGDGNLSEGSMRCDVNVSVRAAGEERLGTKVEVKNLNSFSAMQRAVDFEFERQAGLLEAGRGDEIVQETRLWDENKRETALMRKKEGAADYRYFPEPDLPPLVLSEAMIKDVRSALPELPADKRERYLGLGLPEADVLVLAGEQGIADYFDACMEAAAPPKPAANWIIGDILGWMKANSREFKDLPFSGADLAEMVGLIEDGTISGKIGKEILPELLTEGGSTRAMVEEKGLSQVSDPAEIEAIIDGVMDANPQQLEQFRAGKTKLQGFFTGQVMKASGGRVNPKMLSKILGKKLQG